MNGDDHKAINKLYTEFSAFKATVQERGKWSDSFRKEIVGTLAEINTKIEQLPCRGHSEHMDGIDRRMSGIFKLILICFLGLGGLATVLLLTHIGG